MYEVGSYQVPNLFDEGPAYPEHGQARSRAYHPRWDEVSSGREKLLRVVNEQYLGGVSGC